MGLSRGTLLVVLLVVLVMGKASAEPLVRLDETGTPRPAVATDWAFQEDARLLLTLKPGWGEAARRAINAAWADQGVAVFMLDGETLLIEGLDPAQAFSQLAGLDILPPEPPPASSGDGDDLLTAMLIADAGLVAPDGSASLRVSGEMAEQEALARQFEGTVLAVDHSRPFPYAQVRVRIEKSPVAPLAGVSMNAGDALVLVPFFSEQGIAEPTDGGFRLDLRDANTRINFGVWFLRPGDKVLVVPGGLGADGAVNAHRIQRTR